MGCLAAVSRAARIPLRRIERVRMGNKLILLAVVIVIVAAGIWMGRSMRAPKMPDWVANELVKKIDYKTQEIVALPLGQWVGLYSGKYNLYKNSKTGEYTMVGIIKCRSCGAEIPEMPLTEELANKGHDVVHQAMADYKCPKCGKSPDPGLGVR